VDVPVHRPQGESEMSLRKAAEMALEALEKGIDNTFLVNGKFYEAKIALRQALAHQTLDELAAESQRLGLYDDPVNMSQERVNETAKSKQAPVGYVTDSGASAYFLKGVDLDDDTPLYTAPPKRWVGLTDEEKAWCGAPTLQETVARVEAKLKKKNT
jgi:uncharacterized UPF0160 family protein